MTKMTTRSASVYETVANELRKAINARALPRRYSHNGVRAGRATRRQLAHGAQTVLLRGARARTFAIPPRPPPRVSRLSARSTRCYRSRSSTRSRTHRAIRSPRERPGRESAIAHVRHFLARLHLVAEIGESGSLPHERKVGHRRRGRWAPWATCGLLVADSQAGHRCGW